MIGKVAILNVGDRVVVHDRQWAMSRVGTIVAFTKHRVKVLLDELEDYPGPPYPPSRITNVKSLNLEKLP